MRRVRRAALVAVGVLVVFAVALLWSALNGVLTAMVINMLLSTVGFVDGEAFPSPWLSVPTAAFLALISGGLAGLPFGAFAAEVQPQDSERQRIAFVLGTALGGAVSTGLVWYLGLVPPV